MYFSVINTRINFSKQYFKSNKNIALILFLSILLYISIFIIIQLLKFPHLLGLHKKGHINSSINFSHYLIKILLEIKVGHTINYTFMPYIDININAWH